MPPVVARALPFVLPAGLAVVLLVAFAGVLRRDEVHFAGSNSVPLREPVVEISRGETACQEGELVPADAATIHLFAVWGSSGPHARVTLRDRGGRIVGAAALEPQGEGMLVGRLTGVTRTVADATLCVENLDRRRLALSGDTTPVAPFTIDGKPQGGVAVTALYYVGEPESWAGLLPRMIGRVGAAHLTRGWIGWAGLAAAFGALVLAAAAGLRAGRSEA